MPTSLTFSTHEEVVVKSDKVDNLINLISQKLPFLIFPSMHTQTRATQDGRILEVSLELKGIRPQNADHAAILYNRINDRLKLEKLPFELTTIESPPLNEFQEETLFFNQRLFPELGENAKALKELQDTELETPDEFRCLISSDIMDNPVHDIRSPHVYYDRANIMYWLDQNIPRFMPDTKLPYDPCFLKTNYSLKQKITHFVSETIANFNEKKLNTICTELKVNEKLLPKKLNLALQKAIKLGNDQIIKFLVVMGADIHDQDNEKEYTALHFALIDNQLVSISNLLKLGAKLHVPCIDGITPKQLISALPHNEYEELKIFCDKLKLSINPEYSSKEKFEINRRIIWGKRRKDNILLHTQESNPTLLDIVDFSSLFSGAIIISLLQVGALSGPYVLPAGVGLICLAAIIKIGRESFNAYSLYKTNKPERESSSGEEIIPETTSLIPDFN